MSYDKASNEMKNKKNKTSCEHVVVLKKQLFKNKTVHLARVCNLCGEKLTPRYAARTKENLRLAVDWLKESEETFLMDELMGLKVKKNGARENSHDVKKLVNVVNVPRAKTGVSYVCGICENNCGNCKVMAFCPCHWP